MNDITSRFKEICNVKKIRQVDLQNAGGGSRPTVSAIFTKRQKPNLEIIDALIELVPMMNVRWLFTGEGKMFTDQDVKYETINVVKEKITEEPERYGDSLDVENLKMSFEKMIYEFVKLRKENRELREKLTK